MDISIFGHLACVVFLITHYFNLVICCKNIHCEPKKLSQARVGGGKRLHFFTPNLLRTICTKFYYYQSGFVVCISKNILVCFISVHSVFRKTQIWSHQKPRDIFWFRFLAALRKQPRFTVFVICLCITTKMLTHGTGTAVDSLVLFQTYGTNFVLNFNSAFIAIL